MSNLTYFCTIWCNKRLVLTYICNPLQLQNLIQNNHYLSIFKCSPFLNGWSQDADIRLNVFVFSRFFRFPPVLLSLVQQETRFDLHVQSCPISDFLSKHPQPIHFQMVTISQQIELGCGDQTQCFRLFKFFQNPSYFAQFDVTGDSF